MFLIHKIKIVKMAEHLLMIAMLAINLQRVLTKLRQKPFNPVHLTKRAHHRLSCKIQNLTTAKMKAALI